MDDPWGSPWAAADNSGTATPPPPRPAASAADSDGPQPPPAAALTSAPSLLLPSITEPSPWADDAAAGLGSSSAEGFGSFGGFGDDDAFDDSAFGDWATATPTTSGGGGGGSNGWAMGGLDTGSGALSGHRASESPERRQRLSPFPSVNATSPSAFSAGAASPIAWPSPTASRSPSRAPSRSPATSISAKRAPSLAPRRDEPEREREREPERRTKKPSPERKRRSSGSSGADSGQGDPTAGEGENESGATAGASSDGDDGDDAVEGNDSPITSIDEDTAGTAHEAKKTDENDGPAALERRLPLQQNVPPKVQELVVHFDGLSATASGSRRPSRSPPRAEKGDGEGPVEDGGDDDDDFADFEGPRPVADVVRPETPDPHAEDQDAVSPGVEPVSEAGTARTTPARSSASPAASVPAQATSPVRRGRPRATTTEPPILSIAALLDHYGPITPYTPPASTLDALFAAEELLLAVPPTKDSGQRPDAPALDGYVPDHVLTDSFTAISERRVWHRIARAGSSRRNRAGVDDDNYRPITWATSTAVRPDTLRIVRRWVEEDAFTGRATLGGGRGGRVLSGGHGRDGMGSMAGMAGGGGSPESSHGAPGSGRGHVFGWDSTAAPLALDSVYRKKRPKTRPVSMGSNTVTATAPARVLPGPSALAATAVDRARHALPATRHSVHFTGAQRLGGGGLGSPIAPTPTTVPAPSTSGWTLPALHGGSNGKARVAPPVVDDGDGDDDWGEMVSSPVVSSGFPGGGAGSAAAALALPLGMSTPPAGTSSAQPQPQPLSATGDDVDGAVEAVVRGLPDLSYMIK